MPGICLNMIVKNEMANLPRCLAAVAPYIDCWVIADTGSTDGTQDFIETFFAERKLPGELHSVPFVDFEQARNQALACAYASPLAYDYLLLDDADMELVVEDAAFRDGLAAPGYQMIQRAASGMVYWNTRLVRRDAGARYHGVTHEYLDVPGGTQQLDGVWYKDHASGANRTDKFERDIRLLTNALETEQDPFLRARYTFYLAQSYHDCGEPAKAIEAYLRRAAQGYWDQEIFYSLYRAAQLKEALGDDHDEVIALYLRASDAAPNRAEALHGASRLCRTAKRHQEGCDIARRGLALTAPVGGLFVEPWIYAYGLHDEFAVNAFWAGEFRASLDACLDLLAHPALPAEYRDRLLANARLALTKLPQHSASAGAIGSAPAAAVKRRLSYGGLETTFDTAQPHLGGGIKLGDPYTWCPSVWDYLIARFGIETAMDLGSGCGNAAAYFHRKGVRVIAVEGHEASVRGSLYPAIRHDLSTAPVVTRVDLVHCHELVEHIEPACLDHLLSSMLSGRIIVMTHAVPGQPGHHHVNLQPQAYWVSQFERRGAVLLEEDSRRIRELARRDQAPYMAATGLVFANTGWR